MSLFGTNGVRGRLDTLTPKLAFHLAASFAAWCGGKDIMIGRDMRLTSPMMHSAAKAGIMAAGKNALDIGLVSSPVAEFAAEKQKPSGLIIVTASHNAPEWNALKFVDGAGAAVSRERGAAIEDMALSRSYSQAGWEKAGKDIPLANASALHSEAVLRGVDAEKIRRRRLRLVLDFGNGTSSLSRGVFEKLGCEVIALNADMDGNFPGRPSEPSEKNVQGMLAAVRKQGADMGAAWDGDSDRVVFANSKGRWIVGDRGFAISALAAVRESGNAKGRCIVTTVATSRAAEEACANEGAPTVYTKVGAPYLSEKMIELSGRAVSGGEEVGGIIWPGFSLAKDGIFATAKICGLLCGQSMEELADELPAYFNSKCRMEIEEGKKTAALASALAHAKGMQGRLTTVDGVRVDLEDGWAIVRASGTENAMRVFAEGKTQKRAESLRKELEDAVRSAAD